MPAATTSVSDPSYVASIAARGVNDPERRAELCDRLLDAQMKLDQASDTYAQALGCDLEGQPWGADPPSTREQYEAAAVEFREASDAVTAFLRGES